MFAYCLNSPTTYIDDSGEMACTTFLGDNHVLSHNYLTGCRGGGNSKAIPSSRAASAKVIEGEMAFFTNTSEEVVLDAEYFAFYKGHLVIRTDGERSGSFGILFITRETNTRKNPKM